MTGDAAPAAWPRTAAIIGGGPAGLMVAEVLADAGFLVGVYDLHRSMGRKLLLAGRSGLNLTHSEPIDDLVARYSPSAPALDDAVRRFDAPWLRAWAAGLGEETFVGSSGRVFPEAFRAAPLLRAWLRRLDGAGVTFHGGHRWIGWADPAYGDARAGARPLRFQPVAAGAEVLVEADVTVLALGGASWPRVGSDGSWTAILEAEDIEVRPLRPSNCGVVVDWSTVFVDRFEGTPVKNVTVSVGDSSVRGEIVVTRGGLEGGPVYAVSGAVRRGLDSRRDSPPGAGSPADLRLDLAPDLPCERLATRLASRRPKETQSSWLRRAGLAPVEVGLLREATGNRLPDDADALATLAKSLPIAVEDLVPIDRAISSAGGVAFAGLDDHFMLREIPGTFVVGEMLDWDAPTGGYLLQACFATGAVVGENAVRWFETSD